MPQAYKLTQEQIHQLQVWIEVDLKTQEWICQQMGWGGKKPLQRLIRKHGWTPQRTGPRGGELHPEWKGGVIYDKFGYRLVYSPGHPFARRPRKKYVLEHRIVMERELGRYLLPSEVVDHMNGNVQDNRPENLRVFQSNGEHLRATLTGKKHNVSPENRAKLAELMRQRHANGLMRHKSNASECNEA